MSICIPTNCNFTVCSQLGSAMVHARLTFHWLLGSGWITCHNHLLNSTCFLPLGCDFSSSNSGFAHMLSSHDTCCTGVHDSLLLAPVCCVFTFLYLKISWNVIQLRILVTIFCIGYPLFQSMNFCVFYYINIIVVKYM